jgi:CelD/BcsL family acetyltransferase involved in cellulose biosynthesis
MQPYSELPDPAAESAAPSDFFFYPTYPVAFEPRPVERRGDWLVYTPYTFACHYIDLHAIGSFESYLKQFSGKSRSTLLRKVRRFEEASGGSVDVRSYASAAELDEFFAAAMPLVATTYQARLIGNALPTSAAFIEKARARAERGEVRAFLLFLAGEPVAYLFCFLHDGILSYNYVGYQSAQSASSPGTVLQHFVLQSVFADPACAVFDFTEGEGAQKQFFGRESRHCAKSYFLRRSPRSLLLVHSHRALGRLVSGAGSILDRLGLAKRLRSFLRRAG